MPLTPASSPNPSSLDGLLEFSKSFLRPGTACWDWLCSLGRMSLGQTQTQTHMDPGLHLSPLGHFMALYLVHEVKQVS